MCEESSAGNCVKPSIPHWVGCKDSQKALLPTARAVWSLEDSSQLAPWNPTAASPC